MSIQLSDHFTYKKLLRFVFPSIILCLPFKFVLFLILNIDNLVFRFLQIILYKKG